MECERGVSSSARTIRYFESSNFGRNSKCIRAAYTAELGDGKYAGECPHKGLSHPAGYNHETVTAVTVVASKRYRYTKVRYRVCGGRGKGLPAKIPGPLYSCRVDGERFTNDDPCKYVRA